MGIMDLFMIGIGLAMDAFAVSVGKGLSLKKMQWKIAAIVGGYFGIFQALMPFGGYLSGRVLGEIITSYSGIIAFLLLGFVGGKMIKEAFENKDLEDIEDISFWNMIVLSIATSIDAFAVGITFAFYEINIWLAMFIIGTITFTLSMLGVKIGNVFGNRYEKSAQLFGGVILIVIGLKSLLEFFGN